MAAAGEVGFSLSGRDNDSFMYYRVPGLPACRACGLVDDARWINPDLRLRQRKFDLSHTYDGATIASERFVKLVGGQAGAVALPLPSEPGFFLFDAAQVVRFDAERRRTRFEDPCKVCGRFTQVAGATPVFLSEDRLPDGFSRTDVEFGSRCDTPDRGYLQHGVLLVSPDLAALLRQSGLRGLDLKPIASST